ncbi:hypothetical protein AB0B07_16975 [Streptomyces sioyaensis]|uniref:hypothetical protein n=1 Tax=Streptomyces sioyaensis TaxID=67364 RepID=UPI0033E34440
MPRPGLDEAIVGIALAEHCTDITKARTTFGQERGYRLYTARWAPPTPLARAATGHCARPGPQAGRRPGRALPAPETGGVGHPARAAAPRPRRHRRPRPDLAPAHRAPYRPPLYGPAAHQPTARPGQLLLFTEQRPAANAHPAVDLEVLRTDLEALELTADQLRQLGRAAQRLAALRLAALRLAALRMDADQRVHGAAAGSASGAQRTPPMRTARTSSTRTASIRTSPAGTTVHRAECSRCARVPEPAG